MFLAVTVPLAAATSPEFAARREKLRKSIPVLTPEPDKDSPGLKWTGRKLGSDDSTAREITGFSTAMPAERFESELRALLDLDPDIYAQTSDPTKIAPLRTVIDSHALIAKLRMEKSEDEISRIQNATDASIEAHRAAWRMIRPGEYEYEIAAVMVGTYMMDGCRRSAYAPFVASGHDSATLHYSRNSRRMDSGEVVVMDVAAECGAYASRSYLRHNAPPSRPRSRE